MDVRTAARDSKSIDLEELQSEQGTKKRSERRTYDNVLTFLSFRNIRKGLNSPDARPLAELLSLGPWRRRYEACKGDNRESGGENHRVDGKSAAGLTSAEEVLFISLGNMASTQRFRWLKYRLTNKVSCHMVNRCRL